jgi:hypothetical protein
MNKTPIVTLSVLLITVTLAGIYLFMQVAEKESILSKRSEEIEELSLFAFSQEN